jgi:hypothetical protein
MNDATPRPPSTRSPRYLLRVPLRYRPSGDADWRDGRSENISRSGVLFRTEHVTAAETPIEMLLTLQGELGGQTAGTVICHGRVVRIEAGSDANPRAAVAATIGGYRLAHSQDNDPRRI